MFQDHGAIGRIPVLIPVTWENDFPVFGENGKAPKELSVSTKKAEYEYEPLWCCDDFTYVPDCDGKIRLKKPWQWNHTPNASLWSVAERPGTFRLYSGKLSANVCHAANTLTQRTVGEHCAAEVTLDGSELRDGDYAGLCTLQGEYGLIALTKENGQYFLVQMKKKKTDERVWMGSVDTEPGEELMRVPMEGHKVTLRAVCDFSLGKDTAEFFWKAKASSIWQKLGEPHQLLFQLDHFVGCRFALFLFSTKKTGGVAEFTKFVYRTEE